MVAVLAAILALALCAAPSGSEPAHWVAEMGKVTRVVDGNTIEVRIGQETETVRLIGVDIESIHPQKSTGNVEDRLLGGFLLSEEASAFTKRMSLGKQVRVEPNYEWSNRDRYARLVRYVYLPDGTLLNAEIIWQGYGFLDTKYPFKRMEEFRRLERDARENGRGMWMQ